MFEKLVKWWLTAILLILPFHNRTVEIIEQRVSYELSVWIKRLDEITIVIFFLFALIKLYKNRQVIDWLYFIIFCPMLILGISGIVSGIINKNSLFITSYGIFDYLKFFLVIFIYAAFIRDCNEFKKILRILLGVAVFIGLVAFIQEFWALFSRYILEYESLDGRIYIFRGDVGRPENVWRMGIYRAPSLMGHPIDLGLYCLLILAIYMCKAKKINPAVFTFIMTGIIVGVSRIVYTSFMFMAGVLFFRGRRWMLFLVVIPAAILFFSKSNLFEFDTKKIERVKGNITYREYAAETAVDVWEDHLFWGVGPGMFGGTISIKYRSPVYEEYYFFMPELTWKSLKRFGSLDQFWPQLLAEMGIIGTVAFSGLFISLLVVFFVLRKRTSLEEMRNLLDGLITYTIIILIYNFGSRLNVPPVLFTYCALAGMGLGCVGKTNAA